MDSLVFTGANELQPVVGERKYKIAMFVDLSAGVKYIEGVNTFKSFKEMNNKLLVHDNKKWCIYKSLAYCLFSVSSC